MYTCNNWVSYMYMYTYRSDPVSGVSRVYGLYMYTRRVDRSAPVSEYV